MKAIAAAVLFVALAACDRSIGEIEQQRTLWVANEPQTYAYTIQVSGWRVSRDLGHPKRVTVSNGSARAEYVWRSAEHAIGEPAGVGTYWSIAAVFDELVAAKRRNARVRARFDERLGFVERAFVDYVDSSSSWDIEIREFEGRTPER